MLSKSIIFEACISHSYVIIDFLHTVRAMGLFLFCLFVFFKFNLSCIKLLTCICSNCKSDTHGMGRRPSWILPSHDFRRKGTFRNFVFLYSRDVSESILTKISYLPFFQVDPNANNSSSRYV